MEKKKIEVEDLNRIQREMEEKNKRRKAALSQEIFDRQKRAAAETKMLKTIEAELAKLDQLLNADVAVLRYDQFFHKIIQNFKVGIFQRSNRYS